MKVIATKPGYFGKFRTTGERFDVPDGSTASWFEKTESESEKQTRHRESKISGVEHRAPRK